MVYRYIDKYAVLQSTLYFDGVKSEPRPHQQQCWSNIVECYKSNDSFHNVECCFEVSIEFFVKFRPTIRYDIFTRAQMLFNLFPLCRKNRSTFSIRKYSFDIVAGVNVSLFFVYVLWQVTAYCYNGECRTHQSQCRLWWGNSTDKAPDLCYTDNVFGWDKANCGYNFTSTKYIKCSARYVLV